MTVPNSVGDNGGELTVTDGDDAVEITNDPTEASELVRLTETGSNTGVFESQNDDDSSNIVSRSPATRTTTLR